MTLLICCQGEFLLADRAPQRAEEFLEQRASVVRPGSGLRVVLDTENRLVPMPQPLDGSVIEVHMRHLEVARSFHRALITFDRKSVVLRGDKYATSLNFLHRVISAPMTVGHLHRRSTERQPEELVAEANPEDRNAF